MFTGIVTNMGSVVRLLRRGGGARLEIAASQVAPELKVGDSVAVNGACVTVVERTDEMFACDLVPETVARTNLGILQIGEEVNLELPVRAVDRLGGHIVQGHVDAVGMVRSRRKVGAQEVLEITVPFELTRYLAGQGSVTLDGVSLTIVLVDRDRFRVALIPHTVASTTLGRKGQGASVNVEVDVLSKYVERHLNARAARASIAALFEERERPEPAPEPAVLRPVPPPRPAVHRNAPVRKPASPRKKPQKRTSRARRKPKRSKPVARRAKKRKRR